MFCSHLFVVAERHSDSCNIIRISSSFLQEIKHSMILQLSGCLSVTNISNTQHVFHARFYIDATQQSFLQGKSINLKTCITNNRTINLKTVYIYMDSL